MSVLFLKRFFTAYSFIGTGLSFWMSSSILAQTQNTAIIPVALPDTVIIIFKQGTTKSGLNLLEINSQTRQVKLELNGIVENKDIATIEKIMFKGRAIIRGGKIVIRGENENQGSCAAQDTWNVPLSNVRVTDPKAGKAEINLSSMDKGKQREITQRSQTLTFVVDEMQFNPTGKTILKTTPCRAK